jgi:hypothetical protein
MVCITWADEDGDEEEEFIKMTGEQQELLVQLISEERKNYLLDDLLITQGRLEKKLMECNRAIETINKIDKTSE